MAQRITQLFRNFYGIESTEGTEVLGTATEAFLTVGPIAHGISQEHLPRKFQGQMGSYTGKIGGHPDTKLGFTTELRNRGATNNVPDLDELYKTVFGTRTLDTGDTTTNGSPSSTVVTVASTAGFTVGNAVAVETATADEYEIGWILSIQAGTSLTLEKALTFTPATSKKVKSSLTFKVADSGHQTLSFQSWLDATDYVSWTGCMGSAKFDFPGAGQIPTTAWDWTAHRWLHTTSGTRPAQTIGDSGAPSNLLSSIFKVDATKTDVRSFSVDMAQQISRKVSHNSAKGTFAVLVTDRNPTFALSLYDVDQAQFTGWNAGTEVELTHQVGVALNSMVAMRVPQAQRSDVQYGDDSGLATDEITGQCGISSGADSIYLAFA